MLGTKLNTQKLTACCGGTAPGQLVGAAALGGWVMCRSRGAGLQIPLEGTLTAASCPGPQLSEPLADLGCGPPFFHSGKDGGGTVGDRQECHLGVLVDAHTVGRKGPA